ncbi:ABC transporter ATP-binding protein [Bacillus swezeyi]|uniref:ABC transporter ATP-binding protein n=1 Tax=Bacillus swezeyi TaxID=1925020 RepID=A0A5M8RNW0_9BACI|nr:ABC transporter ATP-binding protein [Bacillus swezeyi]KAA6482659.1 ABC transporter ATP-binding protein [Bacillus swezeyi]TYS35123.1 ABC transporter ATP-binding protein [Bacillus swezeyi]
MVLKLRVHIEHAGYEEEKAAIENIQFTVGAGELVGLIGPNGAGKSTTIKTILGLTRHVTGDVNWNDTNKYAYIPEQPSFYDELTLWEHITALGTFLQEDESAFFDRANQLLQQFSLEHAIHEYPGTFSKGMQQKLMLIHAFLMKPDIYIIDEPFIGLDPIANRLFLDMLIEEQRRGAGILLCTHVLDTAEKICDRFLLLSNGRLLMEGTLGELRENTGLSEGSLLDCFYHAVKDLSR